MLGVVDPVSRVYRLIVPRFVRQRIQKVGSNLLYPRRLVANLLQGKLREARDETYRFGINTTVGVAGFFDPASKIGLEGHTEDFGQTLGYWGIPPGPYLVLPFLGPSNPRDGVGLIADSAARVYPFFVAMWISASINGTNLLNQRSLALESIAEERESALDYYVAVRNAYISYRENQVRDREEEEPGSSDDLYYLEPEESSNFYYREPDSHQDPPLSQPIGGAVGR